MSCDEEVTRVFYIPFNYFIGGLGHPYTPSSIPHDKCDGCEITDSKITTLGIRLNRSIYDLITRSAESMQKLDYTRANKLESMALVGMVLSHTLDCKANLCAAVKTVEFFLDSCQDA